MEQVLSQRQDDIKKLEAAIAIIKKSQEPGELTTAESQGSQTLQIDLANAKVDLAAAHVNLEKSQNNLDDLKHKLSQSESQVQVLIERNKEQEERLTNQIISLKSNAKDNKTGAMNLQDSLSNL